MNDHASAKTLFFVCGTGKCGSTWLQLLLDAHPDVICRGEAHLVSDLIKPMLEIVDKYNATITTKGGRLGSAESDNGEHLKFSIEEMLKFSRYLGHQVFSRWSKDSSATCVGDKTPGNMDTLPMLNRIFPEARFIHIIRDGRDTAVSLWHFNMKLNIGKNLATYGNFSGFAKFFANSWNDRISTTRQVATGLGNHRYIEVRYEDLLDKPQESLSKLFDFLGVGHSSAILNHCLEATRFDKLSEGRQQGNEDPESFYRKGIAGDWRNVFKPEDNDYFYSHAGELMESLGYSKD